MSRQSGGLWGRFARAASVTLVLAFLASCATGPEYKPRAPGERIGYTDLQLSPTRYRVTFSGSSATKRDDVENYLLRRAAELTLAAGYTHFVFDARDTEARTYYRETFSSFDPVYGSPYFGPRAFYWSSWPYYPPFGPYGYGYGYGFGGDIRPVTSYSAYAEIVMLNTAQTSGNPDALDAQFLLQRLVPPAPPPTAAAPSEQPRG